VDLSRHEKLEEFSRLLKETGGQLKLVDLGMLHLTLKFLGNTEEALVPRIVGIMRESVTNIEPFTIHLHGTGAFPNMNYMNVIWVGVVNSEKLAAMAEFLNEELASLGFEKERRKFSAHLTLARVKGSRNKDKVQNLLKAWEGETFGEERIENIRLKKSVLSPEGPQYSTVEEVKFPGKKLSP